MVLQRLQPGAGGAQGAVHAAEQPRQPRAGAAALDGTASAADQGPENISPRCQPMVAVAAPRGARAPLPLQLPGAGSRSHSVHDGLRQERLRVRQPRDGRVRDGHRRRAVRVSGGVGRGRGVLDHPHVSGLDARLPLVEVLDRPAAGADADRGADDRGQPVPGRRSVSEGDGRACDLLHELRARRPRDRPRRALPAVQRRRHAGRGLLRRRRVHDSGRAVRHRDDRAARLAVIDIPVPAGAPHAAQHRATAADGRLLRQRRRALRDDLAGVHALGHSRAGAHARLIPRSHGGTEITEDLFFGKNTSVSSVTLWPRDSIARSG